MFAQRPSLSHKILESHPKASHNGVELVAVITPQLNLIAISDDPNPFVSWLSMVLDANQCIVDWSPHAVIANVPPVWIDVNEVVPDVFGGHLDLFSRYES
ncbi:hypothetical protein EB061_11655 [bacterium]|nr:hypothetical protein [bacterium]